MLEEQKAEIEAEKEIEAHKELDRIADAGSTGSSDESLENHEADQLAVESNEVHEDIVNVSDISQKPLTLKVSLYGSYNNCMSS